MLKTDVQTLTEREATRTEVKRSAEVTFRPEDEVKKIISVSATAYLKSVETKDRATCAKAQIAFQMIYLAEDGYKKCEGQAETEADIQIEGAIVTVHTDNARATLSGDGYAVKCSVIFVGQGETPREKTVVTGGEDLIVKQTQIVFDEPTEVFADDFTVADEFDLSYSIKSVLSREQTVKVKTMESGVSRVIIGGEICVALAVIASDNDDLVTVKKNLPFRMEVACPGAMPDGKARGEVSVKRAAYKVYADEVKNDCTVQAEITLSAQVAAVNEKKISVAQDAYSLCDEVEIDRERITAERLSEVKFKEERVVATATGDVPDGGKIVGTLGKTVTVFSADSGAVSGSVKTDVIFRNADNGTTCVSAEAPFSIEITGEKIHGVRVDCCDLTARIVNGGIELEFVPIVNYRVYTVTETEAITDVRAKSARNKPTCAISVYLPEKGDELWDICKRLGLGEDEITANNPDLVFPLTGNERIIVYRQKTY